MFKFTRLIIKQFDNKKTGLPGITFSLKSGAGFTFLELVITIFVITVGIVGVYIVAQYPISYTSISIQKLTAAYLAQEGIEIVRNIRDTNWVEESSSWTDGLEAGDWEADYDDQILTACSSPCDYEHNLRFLKINGGLYNYDLGTPTNFKRKITIDNSSLPAFLKVIVLVEWRQKGKTYTVEAQENLYPWWPD